MSPGVAELIAALPTEPEEGAGSRGIAPEILDRLSLRPVPVGRLRRLGVLGTLQAKIAAAYLFRWVRGWFQSADENQRLLAETHWRTAMRLLDAMSYLRGAVMKVGQTLANFPDIVPGEFVETLDRLHFAAPPMHWSLLREMVWNELGDEPERIFAEFDRQAFAAASLGQVHRARLKTGEEVAVKIQYPGIARTIREDFRNLFLFLLPARLSRDWENTKDQFEALRRQLDQETDYEQEVATMQKARSLFREDDGIVVPRVFPQYCTPRVITMERLPGVHLDAFLARAPSQAVRNEFARKMLRAGHRLTYAGRLMYADWHPGNVLFMDDGRLGLIDFGFVRHIPDEEWALFRKIDRPFTTGDPAHIRESIQEWCQITDPEADRERLKVSVDYAHWSWKPRFDGGEYDYGDESLFRQGVDLFLLLSRKRYTRGHRSSPIISRGEFGYRSIAYRLKAKFNVGEIAEEEVQAAGWDRSGYAGDR